MKLGLLIVPLIILGCYPVPSLPSQGCAFQSSRFLTIAGFYGSLQRWSVCPQDTYLWFVNVFYPGKQEIVGSGLNQVNTTAWEFLVLSQPFAWSNVCTYIELMSNLSVISPTHCLYSEHPPPITCGLCGARAS